LLKPSPPPPPQPSTLVGIRLLYILNQLAATALLVRKKIKFSSYIRKFRRGAVAKSYMTNGLLILYMTTYLRISSFTVLGSPSSI
jgi:hypothetical protein